MLNLRSVDLNLLPVFEAAYEERSLSKAALRLAMTQPAVSHALARLRGAFRDELFIRHSRGMTPTPTADAIYSKLGEALGLVRAAVSESRGFDPKTSERRFVIAIPHPLGPMLAVRMIERARVVAPGIALTFSTRSRPIDLERDLLDGRVDIALDWLPANREPLVEEALFEDGLVAIARKGHPALRKSGAKRKLADWEFVRLRPRVDWADPSVEWVREWRDLDLTYTLEVSEILEIFVIASQTDLIGIVPGSMALMARNSLGLQVVPGSPGKPSSSVRMIWRASRQADPAHQFLREQMRLAARELVGSAVRTAKSKLHAREVTKRSK